MEKKSGGNLVEEVQSPKTIPNLPKSMNSKHRKSEEDFDYENAAAIRGLRKKKNRRITVTCYKPSEEMKLKFASLDEILFCLQQALYKHC